MEMTIKKFNCIIAFFILTFVIFNSKADDKNRGVLGFINKDSLHGSFISMTPKTLTWKADGAFNNTSFSIDAVSELSLDSGKAPRGDKYILLLSNGDTLYANNCELKENIIEIETSYSGKISIKREILKEIRIKALNTGTYSAPISEEEWSINRLGKSGYLIKDNAFFMKGTVYAGLNAKLPAKLRIDFDIAKKGDLSIFIYSERFEKYAKNSHIINLADDYNTVSFSSMNGYVTDDNPIELSAERPSGNIFHITILADRTTGVLSVFYDYKLASKTLLKADLKGEYLGFLFQAGEKIMNLKNLIIREWNGDDPEAPEAQRKLSPRGQDSVLLTNGDVVSGKLLGVENSTFIFKSDYAELKIPLKRVISVILSEKGQVAPMRREGDIRCFFRNGGHLTMKFNGFANEKIIGSNGFFSETGFDFSVFSLIQFNIYSQDLPKKRALTEEIFFGTVSDKEFKIGSDRNDKDPKENKFFDNF